MSAVPTKARTMSFLTPTLFSSSPSGLLLVLASFPWQMWQLQFRHSIVVLKMTSRKGMTRQHINQMSIIFMSEVGGSSSIFGNGVAKEVFVKEDGGEGDEEEEDSGEVGGEKFS